LLLIVIQPGVEVNSVVEAAAAEVDGGDAETVEQCDADAQVLGCLVLGEAAHCGARKD